MKRHRTLIIPLLALLISTLACNLTEPPTPTFLPPPTFTPPLPIDVVTHTPAPPTPTPAEVAAVPTPTPTPPLPVIDASIGYYLEQVDNDRLLISVNELVRFNTRYVNADPTSTDSGIGGAREWLFRQFNQIEQEARARNVPFFVMSHNFQLTWGGVTTTQTNVYATLPGAGERANEVIIVGAHYDSISEVPLISAPGADDNASGVAVMLECARIMAQTRHQATVVFVAFSAEETNREGSRAFVRDVVRAEGWDVRAMINLDIVGSQTGANGEIIGDRVRIFSATPNESASRHIARIFHLTAATYVPDFVLDVQSTTDREGRYGDHMSFSEAGYPAVRLTESAEIPSLTNTSADRVDRISARYMARVARVTLATLLVLADGPAPPTNIVFDSAGGIGASAADAMRLSWTAPPNAAGYVIAMRSANSLTYDRWFMVGAPNAFDWSSSAFAGLNHVAIAAVDANGRQGPFSPEILVPPR